MVVAPSTMDDTLDAGVATDRKDTAAEPYGFIEAWNKFLRLEAKIAKRHLGTTAE
jgi:hypothetical protein